MNAYTVEKVYESWGLEGLTRMEVGSTRMEVGQDREGLGLIEIRDWKDKGKVQTTLVMDKEQAKLVIECLRELILDLEKKELV